MIKTLLQSTTLSLVALSCAFAQETKNGKSKTEELPNDPAARAFLQEAEQRTASWNGFPGFSAEVNVYWDGKTHQGAVTVSGDGKIKMDLADADARKWATGVLASIAATSNRKDFETRYKDVGVVFGKDDRHPLGQLIELRGDAYRARFRILDNEVRFIERSTADEHITLNILSIERDGDDRKRARSFVVNYFDKKSGSLTRTEGIRDRRVILDGYVLPEAWKETSAGKNGSRTQSLFLSRHSLLDKKAETESDGHAR